MFYSHEILTSRESGIATVWLVATLGSSSRNKKINRRSILNVDVPKACNIIIEPEAPLALRLQGNLLYGVARVHSRQYEYVLSDAQLVQANLRAMLKSMQKSSIDLTVGKTPSEQLVLEDDPAFLPYNALPGMDLDLNALGISSDEFSRRSSCLHSASDRSSETEHSAVDNSGNSVSMVGLVLQSSSPGGDDNWQTGENASSGQKQRPSGLDLIEEQFEDPGFSFDDEGNIIEDVQPVSEGPRQGVMESASEFGGSGQVRSPTMDHVMQNAPNFTSDAQDGGQAIFDDDEQPLASIEPSQTGAQGDLDFALQSSPPLADPVQSSSSVVTVPLRQKKRGRRALPTDVNTITGSAEVKQWQQNYVSRMNGLQIGKERKRAYAQDKKKVQVWCLQAGIGDVGLPLGRAQLGNPLADLLSGSAMLAALTGRRDIVAGKKRPRENNSEDDADREVQRSRLDEEEQVGRGDARMDQDDDQFMFGDDEDIEQGREAQAPLEDPSFPWNATASNLGSRQSSVTRSSRLQHSVGGFPSSIGALHSSVGRLSSVVHNDALDRRVGRLSSASPLIGRGDNRSIRRSSLAPSQLGAADLQAMSDSIDDLALPSSTHDHDDGGDGDDVAVDDDAFELYGPGAAVDTQTAAQSQWVKATLTRESSNFLLFVNTEIANRRRTTPTQSATADGAEPGNVGDEESGAQKGNSITFDQLLPPHRHSKIVGAQALYHVLALAMTTSLDVEQVDGFGTIRLSVPGGVDASHEAQDEEGEE